MAYTNQQLVNEARTYLNDSLEQRFTDESLLAFLNNGILRLRHHRPDLFVGQFASLPSQKTLTDTISFPEEIYPAMVDYVVARAEFGNDESVLRQRAPEFYRLFLQDTKG